MRDHTHTLSDFRVPTLSIECQPYGRSRRYSVAKLMEQHGDAKFPELFYVLADCPKVKAASIYGPVQGGLWQGQPLEHVRQPQTGKDERMSTDAERLLPIQVHLLWPDDVEGFTQLSNDIAFKGREAAGVLLQCLQTASKRFDGQGVCFECDKQIVSPGAFVIAFPDGIVEGTADNATFFACCETCAAPLSEEEILARWAARWQSVLYPDWLGELNRRPRRRWWSFRRT